MPDFTFGLDAWVIGNRWQHHRELDHFGTQPDTTILLDGAIGKYPDGSVLHDVLADMIARIEELENADRVFPDPFTLDAIILPHFSLDAVLYAEAAPSFTLDAQLSGGASFALDAVILRQLSFSLKAYIIDNPYLP